MYGNYVHEQHTMPVASPIAFDFKTEGEREGERLTFSVLEKDVDRRTRFMVVLPEGSGCVTLSFDPNPRNKDPVVAVQSVRHDTRCAAEGLPRKYGTRAMILGALNALKLASHSRYPHLREYELSDEASYPCPPFAVEEEKTIKTFATDLLLLGRTYYERHLNVKPRQPYVRDVANEVRRRVAGPVNIAFPVFWECMMTHGNEVHRDADQLRWLSGNEAKIRRAYEKYSRKCWRAFFQSLHRRHGCVFFSCCWWRLCVFFDMTRLVGAAWYVSFARLPRQDIEIYQKQTGGGSPSSTKKTQKADKEIAEVLARKIRGRRTRLA